MFVCAKQVMKVFDEKLKFKSLQMLIQDGEATKFQRAKPSILSQQRNEEACLVMHVVPKMERQRMSLDDCPERDSAQLESEAEQLRGLSFA